VSLEGREQLSQDAGISETVLGPVVITAPMSGRIVSLKASPNTSVTKGQPLAVLEAMKMENEIAAPKTGIVNEVYVQSGALVKAGDKICLLQ
jgi:biotin carboxyl carrier protein